MKQEQWNKFLDKNIISPGARVYAEVETFGIGGDRIKVMKELSVINVNRGGGIGHFVRDHRENYTFNYETVQQVDSMTPERLAKAYNIK
ncbi:MAG: hypothetical protein CMA64_09070 [Euryarchaeota archaeon]|nr:hypothetical protein [Euryarchaeota archaeon]